MKNVAIGVVFPVLMKLISTSECYLVLICHVYSKVRSFWTVSSQVLRGFATQRVHLQWCFSLLLQYYNLWLSLFGFIMCVAIMFLISWVMSLITFIVFFALYLLVVYRKPGNVNLISHYSKLIPYISRTK